MEVLLDDEAHLDDLRATLRVEVDDIGGCRLDRFLLARLGIGGREYARLVAEGRVRIEGRAVLAGAPRLVTGQRVLLLGPRARPELLPERIRLPVLHEDTHLLVIDKPAGLAVHAGRGHAAGTLANALRGLGVPLSSVEGPLRPGIVHRLDSGTSGVMVVAKTDEVHVRLAACFATHAVARRYVALVRGVPAWDETVVEASLGRRRCGRKAVAIVADGRAARTVFRVLRRGAPGEDRTADGLTLVEARPDTGRKHQIRVHLASLGHPVLGDTLYGGGAPAADHAARVGVPRLALHATWLAMAPGGDVAPFAVASPAPFAQAVPPWWIGGIS